MYDLQNYEFFYEFFSVEKKIRKIRLILRMKKFVKFEFSIYVTGHFGVIQPVS